MNVIGIIAEYNPFHNGHAYQIAHVRKNLHADYIVVATSGDYVQRGEPALLDKYTRARMALSSGADVVLELPVLWSTASAELFADAGISLFEKMGCVNGICFGAESGDLALLRRIADVLADEPADLKASLKHNLKSGSTFPKAREAALLSYFSGSAGQNGALPVSAEALSSRLAAPNNRLAREYLKSLRRRASSITPYLLKREGAAYHETSIRSGASEVPASASASRQTLVAGGAGRCGELVHGFVVVVAQLCQILPGLDDRLARRHSDAAHGSTDGNGLPVYFVEVSRDVVHRLPEGGVDGAGEADDGLHDLVFACHQCHLLLQ